MTSRGIRNAALAVLAALAVGFAALDLVDPASRLRYLVQVAWDSPHRPQPRCAACGTDAELRRHVLAEIPGLALLLEQDPLAAAIALRDWSAGTIVGGTLSTTEAVESERFRRSASAAALFRVFDDQRGGAQCGGAAAFYRHVLALFGFEAADYNIGLAGSVNTHVLSLVAVPLPGGVRFFPLDAWFGADVRNARGAPLDLETLAAALRANEAGIERRRANLRPRPFLLAREEMADARALRPRACRPYSLAGRDAYACRETAGDDFDAFFSPARLGLPSGSPTGIYAGWMVNRVLSVSNDMTGHNKAALCGVLERVGACAGGERPCRAVCASPGA